MRREATRQGKLCNWQHFVLRALVFSLSLTSLCGSRELSFFNYPWISFGRYFYVSFSGDSMDLLYECLCDININHCSLTYRMEVRITFPFKLTVTNIFQNRTPVVQPNDPLFSSSLLCDTLNPSLTGQLNCRRLSFDDRTCERKGSKCIIYTVQQDAGKCSFDCSSLIWLADFTLGIEYHNFGTRALPIKDGVCQQDEIASTTYSVTETTGVDSVKIQTSTEDEDFQSFSLDIPRSGFFVGLGAICLIILVIPAIAVTIELRKRRRTTGSLLPPISFSSIREDTASADNELSITEETDESRYNSLDEMAIVNNQTLGLGCHSAIQHGIVQTPGRDVSRDENRIFRPLPRIPISIPAVSNTNSIGENLSNLLSSSRSLSALGAKQRRDRRGASSGTSSQLRYKTKECPRPCRKPSAPPSNVQTQPLSSIGSVYTEPLDRNSSGNTKLKTVAFESSQPIRFPRPHKISPDSKTCIQLSPSSSSQSQHETTSPLEPRSTDSETSKFIEHSTSHPRVVDLENHQYLSRVHLRQDSPMLGDATELKLVRTQQGHLEMVDAQEELPAFTDFYTRILPINLQDDTLGLVGLAGDIQDETKYEIVDELDIDYIGSVDVDIDMKFEACDYLTVQDAEHGVNFLANLNDEIDRSGNKNASKLHARSKENHFNSDGLNGASLDAVHTNFEPCDYLTVLDTEVNANSPVISGDKKKRKLYC